MMTSTSSLAGSSCCMPEDEVRIDVHMLAYIYVPHIERNIEGTQLFHF